MALDTRTQTLRALESFIEVQRALIARQKDDMERLQTLQKDMSENFSAVLENLSHELGHTAFHLSAQTDLRLALPSGISWSVFDKADTTQLHDLAAQIREKCASRTTPSTCQQSCLSELQMLVKKAKKEIIDPVLEWVAKSTANLASDSDSDDDADDDEDAAAAADDQDVDPLDRKRHEEKIKIMELKKRKIKGNDGGRGSGSSLTTRNVVFVRDDVEDETHDVDVCDDSHHRLRRPSGPKLDSRRAQPTQPPSETNDGAGHVGSQKSRNDSDGPRRRPTIVSLPPKQRVQNTAKQKSSVAPTETLATPDATTTTDEGICSSPRTARSRSDTYKQAWSMDEQHLLERLLEEIPEGEKNRWLKISQAMGGRRTPRQVASRVQKYFEKLKKFGVAVG